MILDVGEPYILIMS